MASAGAPAGDGGTEAEINQELASVVVNGLISNSLLHALDKIKVKPARPEPERSIRIVPDKSAKTLTIIHNGIGMTRSDLYRHAGAVASLFGTKGFVEALPPNADGLGLCSAYLIADKVVITTKHDEDQQYRYIWVGGSFDVRPNAERLDRGTKITLFLKENHLEYLEERRLKDLVNKYPGSIDYPIDISTKEEGDEEEEEEEAIDDDEGDASTEEAMHEWMQIRKQVLLWLPAPAGISGKKYASWWKSTAKRLDDELKAISGGDEDSTTSGGDEDSTTSSGDEDYTTSGGDEDSEDDSTSGGGDEDSNEDSARLASGGGDIDGGLKDYATRPTRTVEGQMGGKALVLAANKGGCFSSSAEAEATLPEHQPWSTCDTEPDPSSSNGFTHLFKLLTVGKCYNCLRSDHFVGSCSFPTRCLFCYCEGHIARNCALLYEYRGPGAPHRRLAWVRACAPFSDAMRASSSRSGVAAPAPVLLYKARVCVEGVPMHARQLETVAGLFAGGFTLVESLDDGGAVADKEAACVCAWVWTRDPDTVARAGTLLIQEPRGPTWPSLVHSDLGLTGYSMSAAGPPQMVEYEVIIHLDRVYDYTPASGSTTGFLLWPRCHVFTWHLGVLDGDAPASPPC
ncbi:unnamed protein product [Urochloa humidicola]